MPRPLIELCVENTDGLLAAQAGGADRVELCASLLEGGLTPSLGMVREALRVARVPVFVMVRPRGGDFLYSEVEFAAMREDVKILRGMGVPGVVFGCLTAEGQIDTARMGALVEAARPMQVTCHRAFDMVPDPVAALEALIALGVERVLTSGLADSAVEGLETLRETVEAARGRIKIMACGELTPETIAPVWQATQADELHFAALIDTPSGMRFRNPKIGMGGTDLEREYTNRVTDADLVRRTIAALGA